MHTQLFIQKIVWQSDFQNTTKYTDTHVQFIDVFDLAPTKDYFSYENHFIEYYSMNSV